MIAPNWKGPVSSTWKARWKYEDCEAIAAI
jgi:hypothetical protein